MHHIRKRWAYPLLSCRSSKSGTGLRTGLQKRSGRSGLTIMALRCEAQGHRLFDKPSNTTKNTLGEACCSIKIESGAELEGAIVCGRSVMRLGGATRSGEGKGTPHVKIPHFRRDCIDNRRESSPCKGEAQSSAPKLMSAKDNGSGLFTTNGH